MRITMLRVQISQSLYCAGGNDRFDNVNGKLSCGGRGAKGMNIGALDVRKEAVMNTNSSITRFACPVGEARMFWVVRLKVKLEAIRVSEEAVEDLKCERASEPPDFRSA